MTPDMTLNFWLAVLLMGALTFALRAAPLLLPKRWLQSQLLADLNAALPLCVLILLILAGLHIPAAPVEGNWGYLAAELLALLVVLLLYIRWRNVLLCMAAGVAALNVLLALFGAA